MGTLEFKVDGAQLERLGNLIAAAGKGAPTALARAVNHTGDKAKTQMIRALVVQTGLKRGTFVRALKVRRASAGSLAYSIRSSGGDVSLKYFGARETRAGVSAAPWNRRQVYAHTFMKGGRFPRRVALPSLHGQVMERVGGSKKLPIAKQKSGLFIPQEMVTSASAAAFYAMAERELPGRLMHELLRIIEGVK